MNDGVTGPENCTVTEHRELNPLKMVCPFDTGDEVIFLGVKGIVIDDGKSTWHKFMTVELENGRTFTFEPDGSFFRGSDVCLFLVAKNKVKPKVKKYRYAYEKNKLFYTSEHMSESVAFTFFNTDFNAKFTKLEWTMIEEVADA